jgi:Polyketide cyclase / dehydrase and lipid transport
MERAGARLPGAFRHALSDLALASCAPLDIVPAFAHPCREGENAMALKEAVGRVHIPMPRAEAWNKLRDLTLADNYVPGVTAIRIDTESREGVGASRTVFMQNGSEMQETVEEWDEGHGFLIRLHKGDKPAIPIFKRFYFRYRIEDDGAGTAFLPAMVYETRFGPIGWLMGRLIHKGFEGALGDIGLAMREHYVTGNKVGPERLKELKAAAKAAG